MRTFSILLLLLAPGCISPPTPVGPGSVPTDVGDAGSDRGHNHDDPDLDVADSSSVDLRSRSTQIASIAITNRAVCVSNVDDQLVCWGANAHRLLAGEADTSPRPPFWRDERFHLGDLVAGAAHICGTALAGVECWGLNIDQQASPTGENPLVVPSSVVAQIPRSVSAGSGHTCAVFSGRSKVTCWGANTSGRIEPQANTGAVLPPTSVEGSDSASRVAAGIAHTCAELESVDETQAGVWCWGSNSGNQVDPVAAASPGVTGPVRADPGDFTDLDAAFVTCGISAGEVVCWGDNSKGLLGGGASSDTKAKVEGVSDPVSVTVSTTHACALESAGTVWCWGEWLEGGARIGVRFEAPDGDPFEVVSAGRYVTCAATRSAMYCWGSNGEDGLAGQFDEDAAPTDRSYSEPTPVPLPSR